MEGIVVGAFIPTAGPAATAMVAMVADRPSLRRGLDPSLRVGRTRWNLALIPGHHHLPLVSRKYPPLEGKVAVTASLSIMINLVRMNFTAVAVTTTEDQNLHHQRTMLTLMQ